MGNHEFYRFSTAELEERLADMVERYARGPKTKRNDEIKKGKPVENDIEFTVRQRRWKNCMGILVLLTRQEIERRRSAVGEVCHIVT